METTHSFLQEDRHEHHQHEQPVNRLPTEVLSWIFVLCAHVCCSGGTKFSAQTNVPAVCRRWRAVALATTNLWTRIRLSNRASRARSALFLLRSGPTVPLDIGLEMTEATWTYGEEDPSPNIKLPRDLFAFIIKRGGDLARWQSLCIRADRISSLRGILEFLSSHFFPNLCHFELLLSLDEEESHLEGMKQTYLAGMDPRPLLHSTPQTLHTVKLSAVPYSRMFGHTAHPQFVGLTHLELRFALYVPTFAHTYKLLAASSNELVILRLDSANQARLYPTSEPFLDLNQPPRVTFPKLEALSLSVGTPQWDLGVLQIIDAPNLAVLQIYPGIQSETARAHYLCILNLLTYDPDTPPSPPSRPYFPSLIHLSYHCAYANEDLGRFFDVYKLSSLTIPENLWPSKTYTWLLRCQSVTRLRVPSNEVASLRVTACERYHRGAPLESIEITDSPEESENVNELKTWVETVVVRHARAGWEDDDPMNW